MGNSDPLGEYRDKRDFGKTPEPRGQVRRSRARRFVVQKHAARRLHYDFRLELDGVLKSWAVTRGPSLDPAAKRLAVRTEDHPVSYRSFEGVIPSGYGAGTVMLWDQGNWTPIGDASAGLAAGKLKFRLDGKRLRGEFTLVRMRGKDSGKRENWLLIKAADRHAEPGIEPARRWTTSVTTDRDLEAIAQGREAKGGQARLRFVPPQLASAASQPPAGEEWWHELKYDGYRIQALVEDGRARLLTRNGKDWTRRYPAVARALERSVKDTAIIDGELVALDEQGRSRFSLLQKSGETPARLAYYAFDLLQDGGKSLRDQPLSTRKQALQKRLAGAVEPLRYSDHIEGDGDRVIRQACAMGLEGIISKQRGARYRSGRTRSWVKSKCLGNDEFVVGGYRRSDRPGRPFSSLLLGEYVDGELRYRGRVGTGFDARELDRLASAMRPLERAAPPFARLPAAARRQAVWLEPRLVAQVAYTERTDSGVLRHPSYLGLREDKPPRQVSKEPEMDNEIRIEGVRLTSPDRVLFPQQGATKRALAEYWVRHADHVLRYLADRPLSLVRCPGGRDGECFFQRHHTDSLPPALRRLEIREKDGDREPYLYVDSVQGLVASAQIGALELHPWGVRRDRIDRPERLVFDLDPDPGLGFEAVREAALEVREVLAAADLVSFPLLTGGKGIHVVVPLLRRRGWEDVKGFARGLARRLAKAAPERYVATASKSQRRGRIFIDWLRNERGGTAIAPYSPRARAGAPVATPVTWGEVRRVESAAAYTLDNIGRRLGALRTDPWDGYAELRQSLTARHLEAVE